MSELASTSGGVGPRSVWQSDFVHRFRTSPVAVLSALVCVLFFAGALLAPWIAPTNPYDLKTLNLLDSRLPPAWMPEGDVRYLLGTDNQGAGVLSSILFGARVSLLVGFASVILSMIIGVALGLVSGYFGGRTDAVIMRMADVQLTFPAILVALLLGGIADAALPEHTRASFSILILILAIGVSNWVQFARTVRGSTLVQKNREYVLAARMMGLSDLRIMYRHILPNVMGPVLVIATIGLAFAVITEATLSFLGVGVPITEPSLGMLIRFGYDYLFSGEWWTVVFPSGALVVLALAVNLLGDWLRDMLDPGLR
ncbi:MAG: ABC transporter permease [Immundisolibacterales bacterium]|nr:ABC transporter permease [Immundisolibacterales bacterium]